MLTFKEFYENEDDHGMWVSNNPRRSTASSSSPIVASVRQATGQDFSKVISHIEANLPPNLKGNWYAMMAQLTHMV